MFTVFSKKASENDQEIPQSHTKEQEEPQNTIGKTIKVKKPALSSPSRQLQY